MKKKIIRDNHPVAEFFAKFIVSATTIYTVLIIFIVLGAKLHLL